MQKISSNKALFIKLGISGEWESSSIKDNTIQLGYKDVSHDLCLNKKWEETRANFPVNSDQGSVTRHINQVRQFYEEPEDTLWITFHSDCLWWCFAKKEIKQLPDLTKIRYTKGGWRNTDLMGNPLIKGRLSGKLLAVQSFRGTICSVNELNYLLHKINGTTEPHIAEAENSVIKLQSALMPIIKNLHPKDLETLTDLIFRQSGWQRTGVAGEVEKDIDLDLLSPITLERIAVQVKSKANKNTFDTYKLKFSDMSGFSRFYFVTHSPDSNLSTLAKEQNNDSFVFWGVDKLAELTVRNGLVGWLIDRAS